MLDDDKKFGFVEIQVPVDPSNVGDDFVLGTAQIVSHAKDRGVARIQRLAAPIDWLEDFNEVVFELLADGETRKAIRKATEEDIKQYRVPIWIQSDEEPECCGQPMFFVGQIDDDTIFNQPPPDAKVWWHDRASFYVFTCSQCLSVKALGQQF